MEKIIMSEDAEIRGVIPNYYAFIMGRLNRIAALEDQNNYPEALDCALKCVKYLPRKLKNQLLTEKTRIINRLNNETKASGYHQNIMQKEANYKLYKISQEEEDTFVDKITTLLDQEHLLTQSYGIPTKSKSMKDIQMTVDQARYEQEKAGGCN